MNYNQEVLNIFRKYKPDEYQVYENLFIDFLEGEILNFSDEKVKFIKHIYGRLLTNNIFNIENSFRIMEERAWDSVYIYVDVHDTILVSNYTEIAKEYLPLAKETLQRLTNDKRFKLVLYTCSYPNEIEEYLKFFSEDGIVFDAVNKYPVSNNTKGFFEDKPYFNILLEDKSGFVGKFDWFLIDYILDKYEI